MNDHVPPLLAGRLAVVLAALLILAGCHAAPTAPVLLGIDVLERDDYEILADQRVGLITNHTGLNLEGTPTPRLLHHSERVNLTVLFSPEHGFAGQLDQAQIDHASDPETGLRVYSLYGETRQPTAEMLAELDTLVFDIQDIGTRFYTYLSTMGEAMIAAADHGKRFVILDRPNPINGVDVAGPMLDDDATSFVGWHPIPVRHGMTLGELALMIKDELQLDLDLRVVKCEYWARDQPWERTGLTWVNPSPNMRSVTQALLYPGVGLLETTNVSVGRGTDSPFELVGAPWIDDRELALALNELELPGVAFVPIRFTPSASKHEGQMCGGVNLIITERASFKPVHTGLAIATTLRVLYPEDWQIERYNRLLGNEMVFDLIRQGASVSALHDAAGNGVKSFMDRRQRYLLYP